ncbi:hypothetical protein ACXDF8_23640 [Mycolicibacterium sp. CBM1]
MSIDTLVWIAKSIPADSWLILSLLSGAVVVGLHSVFAHLGEPDGTADTGETVDDQKMSGR